MRARMCIEVELFALIEAASSLSSEYKEFGLTPVRRCMWLTLLSA